MTETQQIEWSKCKNDIGYFSDTLKVNLSKEQLRILKRANVNERYLLKSGNKFGKTTLSSILAIHSLIFGKEQTIVYVTNGWDSVNQSISLIQDCIDMSPHWMVQNIARNEKHVWNFGGSSLRVGNSNHLSYCGIRPSHLILDDLGYFDPDFFLSIYPVASHTRAKITILSSEVSFDGIVAKLFDGAYQGNNNFATDLVVT